MLDLWTRIRRHRGAAVVIFVGGTTLAVISLFGIPGALQTMSGVARAVGHDVGRWIAGSLAVVVFFGYFVVPDVIRKFTKPSPDRMYPFVCAWIQEADDVGSAMIPGFDDDGNSVTLSLDASAMCSRIEKWRAKVLDGLGKFDESWRLTFEQSAPEPKAFHDRPDLKRTVERMQACLINLRGYLDQKIASRQ